jgi:epoxyqueuosine reductase
VAGRPGCGSISWSRVDQAKEGWLTQKLITDIITDRVSRHQGSFHYCTPLVGFASARAPGFQELPNVAPGHLMPTDLLPRARSVLAFFIPYTKELVCENRGEGPVARSWAEAYLDCNELVAEVCRCLAVELKNQGVQSVWQQATHNFNQETLSAIWSHKHVGYLCGLGRFGRHQMLITTSGCAGRLGSLVLDADLTPTPIPDREYCRHFSGDRCSACLKRCPSGALGAAGLDKQRCHRQLLEVGSQFADLGLCDVCGKCATGPCALTIPKPRS